MSSLTLPDLTLAYELRQEGCTWKRIAQGLGCDWKVLKDRVRNLEDGGLHDSRRKIAEDAVSAAIEMRSHGLGWQCIADYLSADRDSLRWAVSREIHRHH